MAQTFVVARIVFVLGQSVTANKVAKRMAKAIGSNPY
jgi:hypothetical protein